VEQQWLEFVKLQAQTNPTVISSWWDIQPGNYCAMLEGAFLDLEWLTLQQKQIHGCTDSKLPAENSSCKDMPYDHRQRQCTGHQLMTPQRGAPLMPLSRNFITQGASPLCISCVYGYCSAAEH
jgi:hypothetical protein